VRHIPRHLRRCLSQHRPGAAAPRAARGRGDVLRLQRLRGSRRCAAPRPGAGCAAGGRARDHGLGRVARPRRVRARGRLTRRLALASATAGRRGARPRAARVPAAPRGRARAPVSLARLSLRRGGRTRARRGRTRRLRSVVRASQAAPLVPGPAVPSRRPTGRDLPRRYAGAVQAEDEPGRERAAQASERGASASARTYSITSPRMSSRLRSGVQPTAPVTLSSAGMRWIMSSIPCP
jgi:hypothetical protein